jgi:predicted CopG family antitoxin
MSKQHTISIEEEYYNKLKKCAKEENKSLTEVAEKAIADFIEKRKKS